jgi:ElaB/YqjD/DUF883 family membrane-anchored ribosome-binding protein
LSAIGFIKSVRGWIKMKIEKLKNWIKAHPWPTVAIIAGVIVLIYYIYVKMTASSATDTSTGTTDTSGGAGSSTGGGTDSGTASGADNSSLLAGIQAGFSGLADIMKSSSDQTTSEINALQNQASNAAATPTASLMQNPVDVPTVDTPAAVVNTPPGVSNDAASILAPSGASVLVSDLVAAMTGIGSSIPNTSNPTAVVQPFVAALNASVNGAGAISVKAPVSGQSVLLSDLGAVTAPSANARVSAVTGKTSGTIEQQLAGLSGTAKLAVLQKSGLAK